MVKKNRLWDCRWATSHIYKLGPSNIKQYAKKTSCYDYKQITIQGIFNLSDICPLFESR